MCFGLCSLPDWLVLRLLGLYRSRGGGGIEAEQKCCLALPGTYALV